MSEHKKPRNSVKSYLNFRLLITVVAVSLAIAAILYYSNHPNRSVSAYCKVYSEQKARLSKLPGDTYPTELFDDYLSNADEIAYSMGKLSDVAPDEIQPDVVTLKNLYEKLDKDPSQFLSISFTAKTVDKNLSEWTIAHCK